MIAAQVMANDVAVGSRAALSEMNVYKPDDRQHRQSITLLATANILGDLRAFAAAFDEKREVWQPSTNRVIDCAMLAIISGL